MEINLDDLFSVDASGKPVDIVDSLQQRIATAAASELRAQQPPEEMYKPKRAAPEAVCICQVDHSLRRDCPENINSYRRDVFACSNMVRSSLRSDLVGRSMSCSHQNGSSFCSGP